MIVKNAAESIRLCLESVAGLADQIVIADTGCTDTTCEIAREFGAIILDVPWRDHFAEARNHAIAAATTDWVLVLDADEELDAEAKHAMLPLLAQPTVGGYLIAIREYVSFVVGAAWTHTILPNDAGPERAKAAPSYFINPLCRLFRRRSDIYFTGRLHEMVLPQVEATGLAVQPAPFCIHHYGHLAPAEVLAQKRSFYHQLLHKRLADDATDLTTLTMCGLDEWEVHGRPLEALAYFDQALRLNPRAFETWLLTARVLCAVHRYEEALAALNVVEHVAKDAHLQSTLRGDALRGLGRLAEARAAYGVGLGVSPNDRLLQAKQDYLDIDLGDPEEAIARLQRASVDLPREVDIHEFLVNALIRTERIAEAAQEAEQFSRFDRRESFLLRAAKLRAQQQQWQAAELLARECVALYPDSAAGHELLMMSLIANQRVAEAAAEAEVLTTLVKEPRSFLRAAAIYAQLDDREKMRACLEGGSRSFPQSLPIRNALDEMAAKGLLPSVPAGSGRPVQTSP